MQPGLFDRPALPARLPRKPARLKTYALLCPSRFRDAVLLLADRRRTDPSSVARAALLLVGARELPDPGEPEPQDRDIQILPRATGKAKVVRRKPRLRLRLPPGLEASEIRRALALALAIDDQQGYQLLTASEVKGFAELADRALAKAQEVAVAIDRIAFRPLRDGVKTPRQAAYVMGFLHEWGIDEATVTARFRQLAPVFHPDTGPAANETRMVQLIEARRLLTEHARGR